MYFPLGYHCTVSSIKQSSLLFKHRGRGPCEDVLMDWNVNLVALGDKCTGPLIGPVRDDLL